MYSRSGQLIVRASTRATIGALPRTSLGRERDGGMRCGRVQLKVDSAGHPSPKCESRVRLVTSSIFRPARSALGLFATWARCRARLAPNRLALFALWASLSWVPAVVGGVEHHVGFTTERVHDTEERVWVSGMDALVDGARRSTFLLRPTLSLFSIIAPSLFFTPLLLLTSPARRESANVPHVHGRPRPLRSPRHHPPRRCRRLETSFEDIHELEEEDEELYNNVRVNGGE
ncbi:hypothetical protein DFH06DRAFT_1145370 [Mycena polygramma]|nr:hypothetical protein DFH06DRAFT_1145370 [Mycena polygramma]